MYIYLYIYIWHTCGEVPGHRVAVHARHVLLRSLQLLPAAMASVQFFWFVCFYSERIVGASPNLSQDSTG